MTTIAFDGKTLAADGLVMVGDEICHTDGVKIIDTPHMVTALAGPSCLHYPLHLWVASGAHVDQLLAGAREAKLGWTLVVFDHSGGRYYSGEYPYPDTILPDEKFAAGSGRPYALAALDCGLSAGDAVRIAAKRDTMTNDRILVVDVSRFVARLGEAAE